MRVGVFSDLHLHSFKPFSKPVKGGINTRSENTLEVLIQVARIAEEEGLDLVCFCGDFWHGRGYVSVPLFNEAYRLIQEIPCDLAMIRGQHDLATREFGSPSGVDIFGDIDGVHILDGSHPYTATGIVVFGCNSDERLDDLEPANIVGDVPRLLLMHTIIRGCKINQTFRAEEGMSLTKLHKFMDDNDITRCFLGDIHLRQAMSTRVHYVGCAIQQSFGEETWFTGMTIWDPDRSKTKFVALNSPRFTTVLASEVNGKWYNENTYFRVNVGTTAQYKVLLRKPRWNVKLIPPLKKTSKSRSSIKLETDHKSAIRSYATSKVKHKVRRTRLTKLGIEIMESVR